MSFVTLAINGKTGQLVFIDSQGNMATKAPRGMKVMVDRKNPHALEPTTNGVDVVRLGTEHLIPDTRLDRMVSGPVESFRVKSGLAEEDLFLEKPTIALWINFDSHDYKTHEFIVAGALLNIDFSMKNFLGVTWPRRRGDCKRGD